MESNRRRDGERTVVPNRYVVHLWPDDLAALREAHPTLAADLADAALSFARGHGYFLADRPMVGLMADTAVQAGDVAVAATTDSRRDALGDAAPGDQPAEPSTLAGHEGADDADAEHTHAADDSGPPAIERTAVFVVPTVDSSRAVLREIRPDGSSRSLVVDGRPLTIGRAQDNGLVLMDGRASRHHARLYGRRGALLLTDLGSTNGSWVNDRRIEEMALGEGDQIRIGDTILVVESVESGHGEAADPAGTG
jgi:hypothetical protein